MALRISRHARSRMDLYEITLADVATVVEDPDERRRSTKGRYNAIKKVRGRLVQVTYTEDQGMTVVVYLPCGLNR